MEKETLLARAEKAGVIVHWTSPARAAEDIKAFLGGRTVCVSRELSLALAASGGAPSDVEAGIAPAHRWAQETATAVVSGPDLATLLPPVSVLVVDAKNIVASFDDLMDFIHSQPDRWLACVTGPSRTADIEKVLVIPAHGPKELHLFIVE
jgi:L-lactate dehydrogenase complex protein LldG